MAAPTENSNLMILRRFEELLQNKLELCMQLQSLVDTSAQSLYAFRTHCSTSRELIKDEIRMLEGKLIQRIGRQLAMRRILTRHFSKISQDLQLSQYLETDLDMFLAQRDTTSCSTLTSEGPNSASSLDIAGSEQSAITSVLDKIKLLLDEELSVLPNLKQWLEIVGLQPPCVKALMKLVGSVEDLLQTSESKLKAVIVTASGVCTCRRVEGGHMPSDDISLASDYVTDETHSHEEHPLPGLRVDSLSKDKGKLPFHIREDVRRLITACRLLRIYTDRLMSEDSDLRELALLVPTQLRANLSTSPGHLPLNSSSSSSATPPNNLVRKESVKSLYWDSWRYRPAISTAASPSALGPDSGVLDAPRTPCAVHISIESKYVANMELRDRMASMLSSFSSDDNFLSSPSNSQPHYQAPYIPAVYAANSRTTNRLTSQSSVMSSVSTAPTTGDEADGSTFADAPSASSSCVNSVFPSSNNILQLVQQYETSPATMKRQYAAVGLDDRSSHSQQSVLGSPASDSNIHIRSSSSTPSLLSTGLGHHKSSAPAAGYGLVYHPGDGNAIRKDPAKFSKSSSLESSVRSRSDSEDVAASPVVNQYVNQDVVCDNSSITNSTSSSSKLTHSPPEKLHSSRRMHHSIHHVFKNHIFMTHTPCAFCEKPLRGLGRKCRHCKFRCHPDCADKVPPSCGLPDGLVREYFKSVNPTGRKFRARAKSENPAVSREDFKVEEDDDTLSEMNKRKSSDCVDSASSYPVKYATVSRGSSTPKEGKPSKHWNFRLFGPKTPPFDTLPVEKLGRIKKQRSMSTGHAREELPRSPSTVGKSTGSPSVTAEMKSPIVRRISGSFSLPRDKRKRKTNLVLPSSDSLRGSKPQHKLAMKTGDNRIPQRETRIFSDPCPVDIQKADQDKRRTASASSAAEGVSSGNNSQDSLSAPSSSIGSSGPGSIPPSPGGISYGRSGSTSTGPPMSPLALTSLVNPRNYRSFMRTVKDQIKSHFLWPAHQSKDAVPKSSSDSSGPTPDPHRTPVILRKRSNASQSAQWYDDATKSKTGSPLSPEEEEESIRMEAEDSFPPEPSNAFPAVLVQPNALLDAVKKAAKNTGDKKVDDVKNKSDAKIRRFSLLEPQEDSEPPPTPAAAVLQVPTVEVEDDNEPSYSSEVSGDHTDYNASPIPWRRQHSLYLRELNIPFEQIIFGDKLGPGTFGEVHRGKWHGDVAIKILNDDYLYNDAEELHEAFKQDLATLRKTRHDNLVLFMGACMKRSHDRHQQIIITSLLSRGLPTGSSAGQSITLHDLIHEQRSKSLAAPYKVQLNRLLVIASQVCQGMGYLHRRGIVHKDLKSKNVFVTHERCIITDYGLFSISKMYQQGRSDDLLWFPKNWLCYLAPEICRHLQTPRQQKLAFAAYRLEDSNPKDTFGVPFSIFSDVYAFGTVLYELCTGTFPLLFSAQNALRLGHSASISGIHSSTSVIPSPDVMPLTPAAGLTPQTPVSAVNFNLSGASRMPRPPDPNLPGSTESALYLIGAGIHPIFRLFRSRATQSAAKGTSSASSTPPVLPPRGVRIAASPPQSLSIATPNTPPAPAHSPVYLLSPSIDETAARELIELISICWSPKMPHRKEFQEIYSLLEKVPKKSLARSPSHPVHGNNPTKEMIHY